MTPARYGSRGRVILGCPVAELAVGIRAPAVYLLVQPDAAASPTQGQTAEADGPRQCRRRGAVAEPPAVDPIVHGQAARHAAAGAGDDLLVGSPADHPDQ